MKYQCRDQHHLLIGHAPDCEESTISEVVIARYSEQGENWMDTVQRMVGQDA